MYGIFTYIWLIFTVNVGIYTIHGSYGIYIYIYRQVVDSVHSFGHFQEMRRRPQMVDVQQAASDVSW